MSKSTKTAQASKPMVQKKKEYTPPPRPKFRTLFEVSKYRDLYPMLISSSSDSVAKQIEDAMNTDDYSDLVEMVSDPANVFVAVGALTPRHFKDYYKRFNFSLSKTREIVVYVMMWKYIPEEFKQDMDIPYEDENGCVVTPKGTLYAPIDVVWIDLLTFICSRFGRIIGGSPDTEWELEEITMEEIEELADAQFMNIEGGDAWLDILNIAGILGLPQMEDEPSEEEEEEEKNSLSRNAEQKSENDSSSVADESTETIATTKTKPRKK